MTRSASFLMVAVCALGGSFVAQSTLAQSAASLAVNDGVIVTDGMPRMLADFGFFADAAGTVPVPGLISYELNTPLWSDGADKLRYLYVPEGSMVESDGDGLLQFPVGSAIIKTFAFGEGADQRYIETRVLLHRADGWIALPYRWNEEQTEAPLALAGARVSIATPAGDEISYRIPNKNQCKSCHALNDAVMPIGPKARNLSSELLAQLVSQGRMDTPPKVTSVLPVWGAAGGNMAAQARAYLDVNCAHCHQPGGGASNSGLDLRWEQDDAFAVGVRKPPVAAGRGAGGLLVSIEPGNPDASILVHRMNSAEPGVAMPELGRSTIDHQAVRVMRDWIAEMDE
ncbi:SO2930 family diheme c-type cytochrome [Erythrobacter sp. Alg231-14]|uniref:SO2930 family diheme c-type cytochrome n=1 Tax=Erythrobacter sp. Alg231-14 TaxID=1922225 RepID=UPI00307B2B82